MHDLTTLTWAERPTEESEKNAGYRSEIFTPNDFLRRRYSDKDEA
jgi:hypothetical protein